MRPAADASLAVLGLGLGADVAWTSPCGGTGWYSRADGLIEVDGRGTPAYAEGSLQHQQMLRTWQNWGAHLSRSASQRGVPVSWLLAIATMETGLWSDDPYEQETMVSPAGAIGVMQIMPTTAQGFDASPVDMYSAARNIDVGARLVAYLADRSSWQLPSIAAKYNSGRLCDESPCRYCNEWNLYAANDYPGKVIRWNNAALLYGLPSSGGLSTAAMGAGIAAAGLLAAWQLLRR